MLVELSSGKARRARDQHPALSSAGAPWTDLMLWQYEPGPVENLDIALPYHCILVQMTNSDAVREIRHGVGSFEAAPLQAGQIALMPAMFPHSIRTADSGQVVIVSLRPEFVLCAANELLDGGSLELVPQAVSDDPLLRESVMALIAEIESGYGGGRIYGESLAAAMAVHMVRRYSVRKSAARGNPGGLTPFQLRRAVDFIQAHLAEDVSMPELAAAVGLSPFHFSRLFKKSVGLSPHQYLVQRRVERARDLLLTGQSSIATVALEVGFCDQSHLAARFKRIYGLTPRAFIRHQFPSRNIL